MSEDAVVVQTGAPASLLVYVVDYDYTLLVLRGLAERAAETAERRVDDPEAWRCWQVLACLRVALENPTERLS